MVAVPVPVHDFGEDLAGVTRELAELGQAVARLYSAPITSHQALVDLARQRDDLEERLRAARLRALECQLAQLDDEHQQARSARQLTLAALAVAEMTYADARSSLTAAQRRARELKSREHDLLTRRQEALAQIARLRAARPPNE